MFSNFYLKMRVNDVSLWVSIGDETCFDFVRASMTYDLYFNRCVKTRSISNSNRMMMYVLGVSPCLAGNPLSLQYSRLWP